MIGKSYFIFDASGKQVSAGSLISNRLDLDLSSGLYLIKVKSEQGVFTKKLLSNNV